MFFNTTRKLSVNPYTGRGPVYQSKIKHGRVYPNLNQCDLFSDIRWTVHVDWVPEVQIANQVYYKEVLTNVRERVTRIRPEMWKNVSWGLHQENAPFSPHLAPCDFFISKYQFRVKWNQVGVRRCREGESDGGHEWTIRRRPATLLLTIKDSHGAV